MRMRRVGVAVLFGLIAIGCGQKAAPAPVKAPAAAPTPTPTPGIAVDPADRELIEEALKPREATHADGVQREPSFAHATLDVWDVRHEAKQADVRDTRREYDASTGTLTEVPLDGTANPAKARQNENWRTKAETLVRRDAALLAGTHRRFREMFADALHLPPLPAGPPPLSVEVWWNRQSFDDAMLRAGSPAGRFVRAIWLPGTGGIATYAGDESLQGLDELVCAGGRVQKESDQLLASVAATQLLREYAAARGAPRPDEDAHEPPGPEWLSTGLGELLSGVETTADDLPTLATGKVAHNRIVLAHVVHARQGRITAEKWTIEELLKPAGTKRRPRNLDVDRAVAPPEVFAGRAWAFCHFLWNYDGGKYRERFVRFVGRVLDGTGTSEAFATEIMGRPTTADWGDVEMEFEWYWTQLLARKVGRDRQTKQWYEPSTEPPSGTVEQDQEFCDVWAERRAAAKQRPK